MQGSVLGTWDMSLGEKKTQRFLPSWSLLSMERQQTYLISKLHSNLKDKYYRKKRVEYAKKDGSVDAGEGYSV